VIGVLKVALEFLAALHDRDQRQRLVGQAISVHVPKHRDRQQSRRPHRPIRLLELVGEARWRHDIARAPDPGARSGRSPHGVISTVLHSPDSIAAAAWRTWIMNEQPPTLMASTRFAGPCIARGELGWALINIVRPGFSRFLGRRYRGPTTDRRRLVNQLAPVAFQRG
jgi:hypothetical protein